MIQAGGGNCNNDEKEVGTYTALSQNLCYKVLHRNSTTLETKANQKEKKKMFTYLLKWTKYAKSSVFRVDVAYEVKHICGLIFIILSGF